MVSVRFLDVSLRTMYAQAKELAFAQSAVSPLTAGTLQTEKRGGRRFVYRYRYDAAGKRVSEYLGPESDEATARKIEHIRQQISDAGTIGRYSRDLRRIGLYSADNSTVVTLASLFNAGVFSTGGVLVGTHAFGVLLNELGASASPFPRTEDVDLGYVEPIQIGAEPRRAMLELLRETGLPFHEVPQLRRAAPPTSFKVRGRPLRVDLLVPSRRGESGPIELPGLGAHAAALPHLRFLLEEATHSVMLGRDRIVPIRVPHAGRFCVHKLAVHSLRRGDSPKREKDLLQAATLAAVLAEEQDFLFEEAVEAMDRRLRVAARVGARRALAMMKVSHPDASTLVERLA